MSVEVWIISLTDKNNKKHKNLIKPIKWSQIKVRFGLNTSLS